MVFGITRAVCGCGAWAAQVKPTQAMFDEIVRENVREFEMEWEEAVEDAFTQICGQAGNTTLDRGTYNTDQGRIMDTK